MHFVHLIKNEDRGGTGTDIASNPVLQLFLEQEVESHWKTSSLLDVLQDSCMGQILGTLSNLSIPHSLAGEWKRKKTSKGNHQHMQINVQPQLEQQPPCKPMPPPAFSFFNPRFYGWAWQHMVWNILLANGGHLSRLCPFPIPISCPPQPDRYEWEKTASFEDMQALLYYSQNTAVFSTLSTVSAINAKHGPAGAVDKVPSIPDSQDNAAGTTNSPCSENGNRQMASVRGQR